MDPLPLAPALQVSRWFNADPTLTLESLRGRVVMLHSFQMLCPGCVTHAIPQAVKVHEMFDPREVSVIGLHTVFEHHPVMNAAALEVFIHEYRLRFPIAIDRAAAGDDTDDVVPQTMRTYGFKGTPSLVLLDKLGQIRVNHFGRIDDLALGAMIGRLLT